MKRRRSLYLLAIGITLGLLIYLISTNLQDSLQYYLTVSELSAAESDYQDRIIRLAGRAEGVVEERTDRGLGYTFNVVEGGVFRQVRYQGFVPDTFKEGSEVVVTGYLDQNGDFQATEILAKCASKYEAQLKP